MVLTDVEIRNATPAEKPFKLADEKGLYILINKVGKIFPIRLSFPRET